MDEHAALLSMLTGPTSSLALLLIMLYGVWKVTTQTLLPKMSAWVDKHLAQVDNLLEQHTADREAWLVSMRESRDQGERIERKIGGLYQRHEQLAAKVDRIATPAAP